MLFTQQINMAFWKKENKIDPHGPPTSRSPSIMLNATIMEMLHANNAGNSCTTACRGEINLYQTTLVRLVQMALSKTLPMFLCVYSTSLLKTMRDKEKLLVTSNFSISHAVSFPFEIVVCKPFQFGRV